MKICCASFAAFLCLGAALFAQTPTPTPSPTASPAPALLDPLLLRPNLWGAPLLDLRAEAENLGFQWLSVTKDSVRSVQPGVTLAGVPVCETVLRLSDGKAAGATILFYDRALSRELSRPMFEKFVADLSQKLTAFTGRPPVERGRDVTGAVRAEGRTWQTPSSKYLLEWSATRKSRVQNIPYRAEFVRLTVEPAVPGSAAPLFASTPVSQREIVQRFVGRDHVVSDPSGDVKLKGIPMVDQGDRGYCVDASVERVLRYYGVKVDQQEIAQLAKSDREHGTSVEAMVESLKKLSSRFGVRIRSVFEQNQANLVRTIDEYNRAARRAKIPEINLNAPGLTGAGLLSSLKPDLYKEIRLKKAEDFSRFQREIQRSIDDGVPLLWGVQIGLVTEPGIPPGVFGGHMRLIVGYNLKKNEVIYSDSWGAGHEEKRMPFDDAWTITTVLDALQPISS